MGWLKNKKSGLIVAGSVPASVAWQTLGLPTFWLRLDYREEEDCVSQLLWFDYQVPQHSLQTYYESY